MRYNTVTLRNCQLPLKTYLSSSESKHFINGFTPLFCFLEIFFLLCLSTILSTSAIKSCQLFFLLICLLWIAFTMSCFYTAWFKKFRVPCSEGLGRPSWVAKREEHTLFTLLICLTRVAIINAKFQIRQRHYHQCSKPPKLHSANAANNLT